MTESFLIFTPDLPSITLLPRSGKLHQWNSMSKEIQNIIDNYKKNDLENQEMKFFNFIDEKLEEMSTSHLHKIVKKLLEKIKDEMKENGIKQNISSFNIDNSEFNLNFSNILSIVNIIINILDNLTTKGKTSDAVKDFIYQDKIPDFKEKKANDQTLSQIIQKFKEVKTLNICLYKDQKDNYINSYKKKDKQNRNNTFYMDPKIIFFFSLFYKAFFKYTMTINYNLNILPIDEYFTNNNNPYFVNEEQILLKGKEYKDIITCNLILIKSLKKFQYKSNINFKMYDSYQIELHNTLTDIFDCNINNENNENNIRKSTMPKISGQKVKNLALKRIANNSRQRTFSVILEKNPLLFYSPEFNNNYLYFQHLLNFRGDSFFDFCFDFNSLDPLLFSYVNYALIKFSCISKLNLILFPNIKFNKRKTTINNFFYGKYLKNEDMVLNYSTEDKKIYYQYLDNTENGNMNNFILKDEKLLNELFNCFNRNLQNLSIILERKIDSLLTLSIDFSTYNNESISICNYDNFNCSIVCFIFNLFKTFQLQMDKCQIKNLDIFYDDFLDEKSYIMDTIKKKFPLYLGNNGFQLNELKLNHINFNISNISFILPFENFPSVNLTELIVSNLSFYDLNNMVNAFKKDKDIFPVLVKLDISLGIFVEDYTKPLEILLKECLSQKQKLKFFNLKLPFNICERELIDILYWIKLNHNNDLNIGLKIIFESLSQYIKQAIFKTEVINCFKKCKHFLIERNLLLSYKPQSDNQSVKIGVQKYKEEEIDFYYNIIHCLQKFNDKLKSDENARIFQNIFGFRGNLKKYDVNIEFSE